MCDIDTGDYASVWDVSRPKARKPHQCQSCGATITPGTSYVRLSVVHDGSASTHKACADCWADIATFGRSEGHTQVTPDQWPYTLRECVDGGEPASEWAPMLARLNKRAAESAKERR